MDIFRRCLAAFNNKKKKHLSQSENQILCDDLIFSIVLRLPLKHAVQCKTLNKNLYHNINHNPTFKHKHALISSSQISHTTLYKPSVKLRNSTQLLHKDKVSVLASSNGLLLVSIKSSNIPYYVFNPITGEALAVDHRMPGSNSTIGHPGLVVDLGDHETTSHHHPFKLVMANKTHYNWFRFEVIVPSGTSSTRVKSRVDYVCNSFNWINTRSLYFHGSDATLHEDNQTRPVYLNDALHWLGSNLVKILVFDLKKERAKVINGPGGLITRGSVASWLCVWFGSVTGSLSFVYATWMDISILVHDYSSNVWRIQHMIANRVVNPINDRNLNHGMPLFFYGEKLFFQVKEIKEEEYTPILLYAYNISRKTWEYQPPGLIKHTPFYRSTPFYRPFVPFLPTLVKVFDCDDDHSKKTYKGIEIKGADNNYDIVVVPKCLHKLQQKFLRLLD